MDRLSTETIVLILIIYCNVEIFNVTCKHLLNLHVMKKKFFFFLSMVAFVQLTLAQNNFTVIKVTGSIVIERTGSPLGIGTSFAQNENLLFKMPESRAAVINPQRGRFLLTSENLDEFKNSKSNFLPSAGKISTRAVLTKPKFINLKDQLEGNCVILNEIKIKIDTTVYPMTAKKYFYISYDYNNRTINKKLAYNKDTLIIKKNELITIDGREISDPQIKQMNLLYLIEADSYISSPVTSFTPVFPDSKILVQEIKVIVDQMEMNTYNAKLNEISAFFQDFYGKIDENSLKKWLNENFGLEK